MKPTDVNSPRKRWRTIRILVDTGQGGWALALGLWDGSPVLAFRWNGDVDEIGSPQSRGIPTWEILPDGDDGEISKAMIDAAVKDAELQTLARSVLNL